MRPILRATEGLRSADFIQNQTDDGQGSEGQEPQYWWKMARGFDDEEPERDADSDSWEDPDDLGYLNHMNPEDFEGLDDMDDDEEFDKYLDSLDDEDRQPQHDRTPEAVYDDPDRHRPTGPDGRPVFRPGDMNPVPQTTDAQGNPLRPPIDWSRREDSPDQPPLDLDTDQDLRSVRPQQLYRGIGVDLDHPDLRSVRDALHGHYDPDEGALPGMDIPQGSGKLDLDNPRDYRKFMDRHLPTLVQHLQQNENAYGLGTHWSTDPDLSANFAQAQREDYKMPMVLTSPWRGVGEDPLRTDTGGRWNHEKEVTMLPGANMPISHVSIDPSRHEDSRPGTSGMGGFRHFNLQDKPMSATARRR